MSDVLQVVATLVARAGSQDRVRELLVAAVDDFRAEPGCSAYVLMEDKKQPGRFLTHEAWADEEALERHMTSPAMQRLGPILEDLLEGAIEQEFLQVLLAR